MHGHVYIEGDALTNLSLVPYYYNNFIFSMYQFILNHVDCLLVSIPLYIKKHIVTFFSIQESVSTPNLLNCTRSQKYWISWQNGLIRLGMGKLYTNLVIQWQDDDPIPITVVTLGSANELGRAHWLLPKSQSMYPLIYVLKSISSNV